MAADALLQSDLDTPSTWTADLAAKYPNGVRFTTEGFPDFKAYAQVSVEVKGLTGLYGTDERPTNEELTKIANLPAMPQIPTGFDCTMWRTPTPCRSYRKTCTTRSKTPAGPQR